MINVLTLYTMHVGNSLKNQKACTKVAPSINSLLPNDAIIWRHDVIWGFNTRRYTYSASFGCFLWAVKS